MRPQPSRSVDLEHLDAAPRRSHARCFRPHFGHRVVEIAPAAPTATPSQLGAVPAPAPVTAQLDTTVRSASFGPAFRSAGQAVSRRAGRVVPGSGCLHPPEPRHRANGVMRRDLPRVRPDLVHIPPLVFDLVSEMAERGFCARPNLLAATLGREFPPPRKRFRAAQTRSGARHRAGSRGCRGSSSGGKSADRANRSASFGRWSGSCCVSFVPVHGSVTVTAAAATGSRNPAGRRAPMASVGDAYFLARSRLEPRRPRDRAPRRRQPRPGAGHPAARG